MHPAHPTEVSEQCVVALTWTLKDTLGEVLDVLETPVEFLVGGDDLLTRIDQALQGHAVGDTLQLHLEPEDAFGDYDEQRVFLSARSAFSGDLGRGMTFDGLGLPANACRMHRQSCSTPLPRFIPSMWCLTATTPWRGLRCASSSKLKPFAKRPKKKLARAAPERVFSASSRPWPQGPARCTKHLCTLSVRVGSEAAHRN